MAYSDTAARDVKENPEIKSFREAQSKKAEQIVLELFPKKITEFNDVLESEMFNLGDLKAVHWGLNIPSPPPISSCNGPNSLPEEDQVMDQPQPAVKKRKVDDVEKEDIFSVSVGPKLPAKFSGVVSSNSKLVTIVDFLKPEIIQLVDRCNAIKMWIQLLIPKIEDGNNFGVSIQEDVLAEVSKAEADAGSYLEQMSRYFSSRAKLVSKVAKYPYLDDYRRSVNEYDEKVFLSFKLILRELRNIYVVLYDLIIKNYEKIVHPRNSNSTSLY